ncbi:MAG: tRNA (N(6)-L-threonylcarbamoyladenosine(37)-C(2))-methylthiotransferase MtaB [Bacteroidetes bacterium]|nr:tRNA (N(6)-L-threonylcarbamoyladenosine(37)-C(2))-methylthiotransferase MtaB [Bacteroidota bacterium]
MKKVCFYTLGCKLNFAETSSLIRMSTQKNFQKVEFEDNPDIFVINTCSVTENANKKCKKIVKSALKTSPHAFIIITGCFAQLKPQKIINIPGVDAVLGSKEKFKLFDLIKDFEKGENKSVHVGKISDATKFYSAHSENDRTRTFLKIQDGCNYYCSFCTIPFARGKSRSDTIENILQKARKIITGGVKEIVLTGVNIGDFGIIDGKRKTNFLELIKNLENLNEDIRFRISSIEPNLLSNDIIEIVANSTKFVPHFHMPLQSGNNEILEGMRRRYDRELYLSRVEKIKKLMPDACIGIDVIVGFPGETDKHFEDTYDFLNNLDCSYLHVFPYSERPNTRAIAMHNVIPLKDRIERSKMLRILSEKKRRLFYEENLGKNGKVLFENENINGKMYGFTENYIKVGSLFNEDLINTIQNVNLININTEGFVEIR